MVTPVKRQQPLKEVHIQHLPRRLLVNCGLRPYSSPTVCNCLVLTRQRAGTKGLGSDMRAHHNPVPTPARGNQTSSNNVCPVIFIRDPHPLQVSCPGLDRPIQDRFALVNQESRPTNG